jgi:hypothetical protein
MAVALSQDLHSHMSLEAVRCGLCSACLPTTSAFGPQNVAKLRKGRGNLREVGQLQINYLKNIDIIVFIFKILPLLGKEFVTLWQILARMP